MAIMNQSVGVLMGGISSERDVSLASGKAIACALKDQNINVAALDLRTDDQEEISQILQDSHIDMAFIALHGQFGEDGGIQAILENCGIAYTGSGVEASRLAYDKAATQNLLKKDNIAVPPYVILSSKDDYQADMVGERCGDYPLIVKPAKEGSSIGVAIIQKASELEGALRDAFRYGSTALIEKYIDGRELTVGILGDEALPVVEIQPKRPFFDFTAKYQKGETRYIVPASIPPTLKSGLQATALKVHNAIGCDHFSRVDFMVDEKSIAYVLELNTIPGFTSTSLLPKAAEAYGLSFNQLCIKLMEFANAKKERTKNTAVR